MHKLKLKDIAIGMKVVTSTTEAATVYTVTEMIGTWIRLSYNAKKHYDAGWVDYTTIHIPTADQLNQEPSTAQP